MMYRYCLFAAWKFVSPCILTVVHLVLPGSECTQLIFAAPNRNTVIVATFLDTIDTQCLIDLGRYSII